MGQILRIWLLALGLAAALPAEGATSWCGLFYRAWTGYKDSKTTQEDWSRQFGTTFETPAALAYRNTHTTPPPENAAGRRQDLLRRLGQLPPEAPATEEPRRILKTKEETRHHGDGGVLVRQIDQYGDTYATGVVGPEASRSWPGISTCPSSSQACRRRRPGISERRREIFPERG